MSIVIVSYIFLFSSLRRKFIFFVLNVIIYSIWGFLHNLDGMFLVLLVTEFTVALLFLMTYVQLYSNYSFFTNKTNYNYMFFILILIFGTYSGISIYNISTSYYSALNHVISSDFFILYYLLFDKQPILVILLTLIIGLFSLFFILLYFNLKSVKHTSQKQLKSLYFLRKQQLIKQTNFKVKLYTFQK
jgi:hypothetical protein